MPILFEETPTELRIFQEVPEGMGWLRTGLLAGGAAAGVLATASAIHAVKGARPELEPRGWRRTALLAAGAAGGTLFTTGLIHVIRTAQSLRTMQRGRDGEKVGWVEEC